MIQEPHVFLFPRQIDDARRAAAVLCDNNLGQSRTIIGHIGVRTMQEHYNISILFDGAALPQICESGPLVFPQFHAAI